MIDLNKTYKTKGGREWRYYGENGNGQIHGALKDGDGTWRIDVWGKNGKYFPRHDSSMDLVEVKPRIKRTYWISIYEDFAHLQFHSFREELNSGDSFNRLACVKVESDCEVGEGL